jgi:hypothetical protein
MPAGLPLCHDLGQAPGTQSLSHDDDEFETRRQVLPHSTKRLAHHALGSISLHRVADSARRRNSQPASLPNGRAPEKEDKAG